MPGEVPLVPGQYYAKRFVIYSALGEPRIELETWRLSISGLVENELSLSFEELQRLPQAKLTRDFHCVTQWSIKDVVWGGVRFRELVNLIKVRPEAEWVMFHCADGYTAPVPLVDAMVEDSMIATKMNRKPFHSSKAFLLDPLFLTCMLGKARSGLQRSNSWRNTRTVTGKLTDITKEATSLKKSA